MRVTSLVMAGGRQFANIRVPTLAIFASPHDIGAEPDAAFDKLDEAQTERRVKTM